jgi:hypothetical protein
MDKKLQGETRREEFTWETSVYIKGHMYFTIKPKECIVRKVDWITLSQDRVRLPVLGNVDEIRNFEFQFGVFKKSFTFVGSCLCLMRPIKHFKTTFI